MGNTTIYRTSYLVDLGGFDPSLHSFADGLACQVLALRHGACFIPEALAVWRLRADGFANSCMRDAAVGRAICERATNLMTTRFGDVFLPSHVRRWRRRWLFGISVARHRARIRDAAGQSSWRTVSAALWIAAFLLKYRVFEFHRIALRRLRHLTAKRQGVFAMPDERWKP